MEEITDVQPSLVMLIVDMHPVLWSLRQQYGTQEFLKLDDVAQICVIFLNTVKLMHRQNEVCVLFSHPDGSELIYPPATTKAASAHESLPNVVTQAFRVRIDNMLASPSDASAAQNTPDPYGLSQALSRALCVINRRTLGNPRLQSRICIVQLTKDLSYSYNAIMNCIFSAQKLGTIVDSLNLGRAHSSFLQQAAFLTGGIYLYNKVDQRDSLQLMMNHFVPSGHTRQFLKSLPQKVIDFKASCICHGKPVEFAYMCSVCLSLFCSAEYAGSKGDSSRCSTCATPFRPATARRIQQTPNR